MTLNRFFLLSNRNKNRTWKKERFVRFFGNKKNHS